MRIVVGIDSHKFKLAAAAVDEIGRVVASCGCKNSPDGWAELLIWVQGLGQITRVGIEGSGQYGSGLACWLDGQGIDVKEVPAHMTYERRKRRPSQGKSDPADAMKIALVTLTEFDRLPPAAKTPITVDLNAVVEYRDQLIRARTQQANRAHALLSAIRPGSLGKVRLTTSKGLSEAITTIRGDRQLRAELIREHVAEIRRLTAKISGVDAKIAKMVQDTETTLTAQVGIGPLIAAKILAETDARVRSKAGFAMLSGTAPLPASSGEVCRHRLNQYGNRRLNHALHMVAVNRLRLDAESKAYYERKLSEGKSRKDALRALKRQVANRVFRCLEEDMLRSAAA